MLCYLHRLEMALRMHDPEVCLPFWDSTLDSHLPNPEHSAIWTPSYMGNNNGLVTSGAFAGWTTNSGCHYGGLLQLGRSTGPSGRCMYQSDINNVMSKTTFQELVSIALSWRSIGFISLFNPLTAKLFYLNFHSLEVVSR